MKCSDFEQQIYLYSELSAAERKIVDDHISECASCSKLLAHAQHAAQLVSKNALEKHQPENFSRLTSNIMQAVANQQKQSASWLNSLFVRYAMVGASLILVIGFSAEQLSSVQPVKRMSNTKNVTLTSHSVGKIIVTREKTPSLYSSIRNEGTLTTFEKVR